MAQEIRPRDAVLVIGALAVALVLYARCTATGPVVTASSTASEKTTCDVYSASDVTARVRAYSNVNDFWSAQAAARKAATAKTRDEENYAHDQFAAAFLRGIPIAPHTMLQIMGKRVIGEPYKVKGADGSPVFIDADYCH